MKTKGFTLIELMIVVAIIGILAAVAMPRFAELVGISKLGEAGFSSAEIDQYYNPGGVLYIINRDMEPYEVIVMKLNNLRIQNGEPPIIDSTVLPKKLRKAQHRQDTEKYGVVSRSHGK